jgi:hypothetical protein
MLQRSKGSRQTEMYGIGQNFEATRQLMQLAMAYQAMTVAAAEVIVRRTLQMATGSMTPPDAVGMVLEKATVFAAAAEKAAVVAARGGDPVRVATAALRPYGVKTKANVRRLRR